MHLGYSWTPDETTAGARAATTASIEVAHRQSDRINDVILAGLKDMCSAERLVTTSFGQCLFNVEALTYVFPTINPSFESLDAFVTRNLNANLDAQYSRGGQLARSVDFR